MRTKQAPYDYNRATLPAVSVENGRNYGDTKETIRDWTLVVFDAAERKRRRKEWPDSHSQDDGFREAITVRCYMGRSSSSSTVYASVWVRRRDFDGFYAGHGSAGGYGYCKVSAAIDEAIRNAGITLEKSCSGCGEPTARKALEAIADAAGFRRLPRTWVG